MADDITPMTREQHHQLEEVVEAGCSIDLPEAIQRLAAGPGDDLSEDTAEWVEVATALATHLLAVTHHAVPAPRGLLESLVDEDTCWFDHHGGCQAHGYLSLQPGELCPQHELKALLATGTEEGARG